MPLADDVVAQLRLGVPVMASGIIDRAYVWVTFSVLGHLGSDFLGPCSLISSVRNLVGRGLTKGLSLALSTLASQAYGAGDRVGANEWVGRHVTVEGE